MSSISADGGGGGIGAAELLFEKNRDEGEMELTGEGRREATVLVMELKDEFAVNDNLEEAVATKEEEEKRGVIMFVLECR